MQIKQLKKKVIDKFWPTTIYSKLVDSILTYNSITIAITY